MRFWPLLLISCLELGAQVNPHRADTRDILSLVMQLDSVSKNLFNEANWITDYQFDGQYSDDRLEPLRWPEPVTLPVVRYRSPIYSILRLFDPHFDSLYYQNEIAHSPWIRWSDQELPLKLRPRYIHSRRQAMLHKNITLVSLPIYSIDGNTAFLSVQRLDGKLRMRYPASLLVLKKTARGWSIVSSISSN